jgi:hypothetical protein
VQSSATQDSSQAASNDTGGNSKATELASKKFKLKPGLRDQLEEQAEEHYSGNASELIRAALNDHFRTLEGENEYVVRKLQAKIADLEEQVAELTEIVEQGDSKQHIRQPQQLRSRQQSEAGVSEQSSSPSNGDLQSAVYRTLQDADSSRLTLGELEKRTDAEIVALHDTVEYLVDRDILTRVADVEQPTFEIHSTSNE